jgi:hypothetical protein
MIDRFEKPIHPCGKGTGKGTVLRNCIPKMIVQLCRTVPFFLNITRRSIINKDKLSEAYIEIRDVESKKRELCIPKEGFYSLQTLNGTSSVLRTTLIGDIQITDKMKKVCALTITVPWSVTEKKRLPFTWRYSDKLWKSPKNAAEKRSYSGTRLAINIEPLEGSEVEYRAIYPLPPGRDPNNVKLEGYTTILEGSTAGISEDKIVVESESLLRMQDHSGTQLEILYRSKKTNKTRGRQISYIIKREHIYRQNLEIY